MAETPSDGHDEPRAPDGRARHDQPRDDDDHEDDHDPREAHEDREHEDHERRDEREREPEGPQLSRRERLRRWSRAHRRATIALIVLALALLVIAALVIVYLWRYESTDDAEVDAHIAAVSSRVTATVLHVYVEDNAAVKAGQLLVELDPKDFEVAVAQAEAQLMQAEAELQGAHPQVPITAATTQTQLSTAGSDVDAARSAVDASQRDFEAAQAAVREAAANDVKAQADLQRARYLIGQGAIPTEQLDARVAAAHAAAATRDSMRARARSADKSVAQARDRLHQAESRSLEAEHVAPRQVDIQRANVASRQAQVKAAQAQLERARLDLQYTRVVAAFDGVVGKRSVEPGEHVTPGQELMALVDVNHPWVTANFKETQLRKIKPGQSVRVHVDALKRNFSGWVESFPGASGARYSLLPPENATGNYVKVVQRLPLRIRLNDDQPGVEALRPGMSVEPRVRVN